MPEVQEFLKKQWEKSETERKAKERSIAKEQLKKMALNTTGGIVGGLLGGAIGFVIGIISVIPAIVLLWVASIIWGDEKEVFVVWVVMWTIAGAILGAILGVDSLKKKIKRS